jgi:hypothetical protein
VNFALCLFNSVDRILKYGLHVMSVSISDCVALSPIWFWLLDGRPPPLLFSTRVRLVRLIIILLSLKATPKKDTRIQRCKPFVTVQWLLEICIDLLSCDVFIYCFVFQVLFKETTVILCSFIVLCSRFCSKDPHVVLCCVRVFRLQPFSCHDPLKRSAVVSFPDTCTLMNSWILRLIHFLICPH